MPFPRLMLVIKDAGLSRTPPEAGGPPPTCQGKAIGDSFPMDWNSKMRLAGQLRQEAGPWPDPIPLIPEVKRPPWQHMHIKGSLEATGELCSRDVPYSYAFIVIPTLVNDACIHMGRFWDISNMDCEPGKSKWLAKGNPEEMPYQNDSNCHEGVTRHSPSESALVCIHMYYTLFLHNKYLFHYFPFL